MSANCDTVSSKTAEKWLAAARRETDPVDRFVLLWTAFQWLYGAETVEKESLQVENYARSHSRLLERFDAFSDPQIEVFRKAMVADVRTGSSGTYRYQRLLNGSVPDLLATLLQIRRNLLAGSPFHATERGRDLIAASGPFLERYLSALLEP